MDDKEENKYNDRVRLILAIFFSSTITFCLTILLYGQYLSSHGLILNSYKSSGEISEDLNLIRSYLEKNYKGEINEDNLKFGALKGYVKGLGDEYTELMNSKEWNDLNSTISKTVGIGAYFVKTKDSDYTVIAGTVEDSPAENAGLMLGDKIKEIDSEDMTEKDSKYIATKVRNGAVGSTVRIKIIREEKEMNFSVKREEINFYKLKHEILENNIGYIIFSSFTDTSYEEFKSAYEDLKNNGAKSLIIDLRNNTGGIVDQALLIEDLFVDAGKTLLIEEDKNGKRVEKKSIHEKVVDMPVVVLVNDYTASASEILTGMLKDYGIAKIVGIKTYGKGLIQNTYQNVLGPNSGVSIKITVAEYYTPNGNKVNKEGIEPDEIVEGKAAEMYGVSREEDKQLQRAIEILE